MIAGLDEAGRGPLAGPVVAAAVILPRRCSLPGLTDSKLLPRLERERLYREILKRAVGVGIGEASSAEIDRVNVLEATRLAMVRALAGLHPPADCLLLDALTLPSVSLPQRAIVKGDRLVSSIAAASIVAKVTRDRLMAGVFEAEFPGYGFASHKGYGTAAHLAALKEHGPCDIHRSSFRPVREALFQR